jgi:hypothetical protein
MNNTRPYDVLDERARGGQRPGLLKRWVQQLGIMIAGEYSLSETPTVTTWDAAGLVMTGTGSTWDADGIQPGDVIHIISDETRVNVADGFEYKVIASVDSDTQMTLVSGISDGVGSPSSVDYEIGTGVTGLPIVDMCQVTLVEGN